MRGREGGAIRGRQGSRATGCSTISRACMGASSRSRHGRRLQGHARSWAHVVGGGASACGRKAVMGGRG